jgi:hypothetical protein
MPLGQAAVDWAESVPQVGYSNTDGFYNTEKHPEAIRLIDGFGRN